MIKARRFGLIGLGLKLGGSTSITGLGLRGLAVASLRPVTTGSYGLQLGFRV